VLFQILGQNWSDQHWAFIILAGFTVFAFMIAVIVQQIITWGKAAS
jgi:hypothetical protein